jgi:hypothetical protein
MLAISVASWSVSQRVCRSFDAEEGITTPPCIASRRGPLRRILPRVNDQQIDALSFHAAQQRRGWTQTA